MSEEGYAMTTTTYAGYPTRGALAAMFVQGYLSSGRKTTVNPVSNQIEPIEDAAIRHADQLLKRLKETENE